MKIFSPSIILINFTHVRSFLKQIYLLFKCKIIRELRKVNLVNKSTYTEKNILKLTDQMKSDGHIRYEFHFMN